MHFRSMARVRWRYFPISLSCCLADIGQVVSGAMASAKSYSEGCGPVECSGVDSLPSCRSLAFLAGRYILVWAGRVAGDATSR